MSPILIRIFRGRSPTDGRNGSGALRTIGNKTCTSIFAGDSSSISQSEPEVWLDNRPDFDAARYGSITMQLSTGTYYFLLRRK